MKKHFLRLGVLFLLLIAASCSFDESSGKGNISIRFDRELLSKLTPSRSAFNNSGSFIGDEAKSHYLQLSASVSGAFKTSTSRNLTDSEITNIEAAELLIEDIPAGSDVKIDVSINLIHGRNGQNGDFPDVGDDFPEERFTVYKGQLELKVHAGENSATVTLKNALVPVITPQTKNSYYLASDAGNMVRYASKVNFPDAYFSFNNEPSTGQLTDFYLYTYKGSTFDPEAVMAALKTSRASDSGDLYNYTTDNCGIYNAANSEVNSGIEVSVNGYIPDYEVTASLNLTSVNKNATEIYHVGTITVYKSPIGTEKFTYSTPVEFTILPENTQFSIESVSYSYRDGQDYELLNTYSENNFVIMEKWGDGPDAITVQGSPSNYSSAFEVFAGDVVGDCPFTFSRNGSEKSCTVNFKFSLPDYSNFYLGMNNDGRSIEILYPYNDPAFHYLETTEQIPMIRTKDDEPEMAQFAFSVVTNWKKDGGDVDVPDLSYSIDEGELSTISASITVTPAYGLAQYCVSEEKTYELGSISIAETAIAVTEPVPDFQISTPPDQDYFYDSDTAYTFYAVWKDTDEAVTANKDYTFTWYANNVEISGQNGPSITFDTPELKSMLLLEPEENNSIMLIIKKTGNPSGVKSAYITFNVHGV